jgi:hypothetical protein
MEGSGGSSTIGAQQVPVFTQHDANALHSASPHVSGLA